MYFAIWFLSPVWNDRGPLLEETWISLAKDTKYIKNGWNCPMDPGVEAF